MTNQQFATGAFVFTRARGLNPVTRDLPPLAAAHRSTRPSSPPTPATAPPSAAPSPRPAPASQSEGFLLRPITRTTHRGRLRHRPRAARRGRAAPRPRVRGHGLLVRRARPRRGPRATTPSPSGWPTPTASCAARSWPTTGAARSPPTSSSTMPPASAATAGSTGCRPSGSMTSARSAPSSQEVGIDLVLCEIEAETRTVVEHGGPREPGSSRLAALEAEAQEFDGTQKPCTYARRLEEYQRLRERAVLYRDALGVGVDRAEQVLTELEQKVTAMLELRVARPSSTGTARRASHRRARHRTGPGRSLRFAGATFTPASSDRPRRPDLRLRRRARQGRGPDARGHGPRRQVAAGRCRPGRHQEQRPGPGAAVSIRQLPDRPAPSPSARPTPSPASASSST